MFACAFGSNGGRVTIAITIVVVLVEEEVVTVYSISYVYTLRNSNTALRSRKEAQETVCLLHSCTKVAVHQSFTFKHMYE